MMGKTFHVKQEGAVQEFPTELQWAQDVGLSRAEIAGLNPAVPGEFTDPDAFYLNTATPNIVYRGSSEGTLPLVSGRWYLIPNGTIVRHPSLAADVVPLARAPRLAR